MMVVSSIKFPVDRRVYLKSPVRSCSPSETAVRLSLEAHNMTKEAVTRDFVVCGSDMEHLCTCHKSISQSDTHITLLHIVFLIVKNKQWTRENAISAERS